MDAKLEEYLTFARTVLASEGPLLVDLYCSEVSIHHKEQMFPQRPTYDDEVWADYYAWLEMDSTRELLE